jgi:hypothetical protein
LQFVADKIIVVGNCWVARFADERMLCAWRGAAAAAMQEDGAGQGLELPQSLEHIAAVRDREGHTPLALAARHGRVTVLAALLADIPGVDVSALCGNAQAKKQTVSIGLYAGGLQTLIYRLLGC